MKVYGKPNAVAIYRPTKRDRKKFNLRKKAVELFKFNDKGEAVIDETKFKKIHLSYIKKRFKTEANKLNIEKNEEELKNQAEELNINDLTKDDISKLLDKKGIEYNKRDKKADLFNLLKDGD
jgi:hypothetical protein